MRFKEKDAAVRYLPGKVGLDQILKRYEDTPFDVTPAGEIVAVVRTKQVTLRGWAEQSNPTKATQRAGAGKPTTVFVELVPAKGMRIASGARFSLSNPPAAGLKLRAAFRRVKSTGKPSGGQPVAPRFVARLTAAAWKPGEITVPVRFRVTAVDAGNKQHAIKGKLDVVLRTPRPKPAISMLATTGVALIGGTLELRLGHLCDQRGCAAHFHKSLADIRGLAAVRPHPSLKSPRATVYLRAGQAVDVWALRETLRDRGVEVSSLVPRQLDSYRLRVELVRWRADAKSSEVTQSPSRRDHTRQIIEELAWSKSVAVAGGGINLRAAKPDVDLIELLNALTRSGKAPVAVWLVPRGVPMPKTAPARLALRGGEKPGGSTAHPVVEFTFSHAADFDTHALALLGKQRWLSRAQAKTVGETTFARVAILDRKYANLTPLLHGFRAAGHVPRQIRLAEFGDIRIRIEFAHVCGEVEYSKPRKRKSKPKSKTKTKKPVKPKKPFVPKPLRPAKSSNGRRAIEAAVNSVGWIRGAVFYDYHTRPTFKGPRKLTLALQVKGKDIVRLDELIRALRRAGFPPKSVIVSRRFPGIPFVKPLPRDLDVTDRRGKKRTLWSLRRPNRPFAVVFVSLKPLRQKKYKKYKADPKLYQRFAQTVSQYKDRVDFVAVSANPGDKFRDVVKFWEKTSLKLPLLHDADGLVRRVFNSQATPSPHVYVFDSAGLLRYAGDPHDQWKKPKNGKEDYLAKALDAVLAGKYAKNGAVFYNSSVCNCSHPKCKCPKCGCGPSCRCGIKH